MRHHQPHLTISEQQPRRRRSLMQQQFETRFLQALLFVFVPLIKSSPETYIKLLMILKSSSQDIKALAESITYGDCLSIWLLIVFL